MPLAEALGAAEKDSGEHYVSFRFEENIVKLTKFNFDENVKKGVWFVKFYAPWCTHCQRLAPIWEKLADQAVSQAWPLKVADVDCTVSKTICEKANIKAFPTLALISEGKLKSKYRGEAGDTKCFARKQTPNIIYNLS